MLEHLHRMLSCKTRHLLHWAYVLAGHCNPGAPSDEAQTRPNQAVRRYLVLASITTENTIWSDCIAQSKVELGIVCIESSENKNGEDFSIVIKKSTVSD